MQELGGEDSLLSIFLAEASEILSRMTAQLGELREGFDSVGLLDELHRGFHTLYGGSRVLELAGVAELSLAGADLIQQLRGRRSSLTPGLLALIEAVASELAAMLAAAGGGETLPEMPDALRQRLAQASTRKQPAGSAPSSPVMATAADEGLAAVAPAPSQDRRHLVADDANLQTLPDFSEELKLGFHDGDDEVLGSARLFEELSYFSRELNWVRDLLLTLQDSGSRDEKRRALAFLDLLATDIEGWTARSRQRFRQ
ncbi:Hpt domain-containing protein [Spongiibacter taiwanensis]|uniref:Hpt domain-containing protein n=1 Tax=Spongiibacter taiwanensis TaxID=1748242 RepID=UPI002034D904|nr:Hpt domain-containing protein [Spongiibacter taiwanensis]USA43165.1 Hpt domain-containing protein [Spongiibacter taiwanensis]